MKQESLNKLLILALLITGPLACVPQAIVAPLPNASPTVSASVSGSPSSSPTASTAASPDAASTPTPQATVSPAQTSSPAAETSPTPTATPTPSASPSPTATPTPSPTATPLPVNNSDGGGGGQSEDPGRIIFAIDAANNNLISFGATTSTRIRSRVAITGLDAGEQILGIDFRPVDGLLYGLGSTSSLYTINTITGVATQVGTDGLFALSGATFGFDFNPVPDRIRVHSNTDQNLRLNPNNGALAATDTGLAYAAGDPNAGANPNIVGSAYTNSFVGATLTTLYGIDTANDQLVIVNPPNNGTANTVGPIGVDTDDNTGFDIAGNNGNAYASLTNGGSSALYLINLATGQATFFGNIGTGLVIRGISATPL